MILEILNDLLKDKNSPCYNPDVVSIKRDVRQIGRTRSGVKYRDRVRAPKPEAKHA